jgi:hypothetical protein
MPVYPGALRDTDYMPAEKAANFTEADLMEAARYPRSVRCISDAHVLKFRNEFEAACATNFDSFFVLSGIAAGQSLVDVGFGIRGGLLANKSFQANHLCVGTACAFGSRSFTPDTMYGTVGPTVNALLYDRVEVRFEAVHRRFGYQVRSDLVVSGIIDQHTVESTQGHLWEYPLLGTYDFSSGPIRPFAGGGLSLGTTGTSNREIQSTQTLTQGGSPITTTFVDRTNGAFVAERIPYYLVAGIDGRVSHVSIRPEFRYSHFPGGSDSSAEAILKPNQFEFLVGVSVQFRLKRLDTHP